MYTRTWCSEGFGTQQDSVYSRTLDVSVRISTIGKEAFDKAGGVDRSEPSLPSGRHLPSLSGTGGQRWRPSAGTAAVGAAVGS